MKSEKPHFCINFDRFTCNKIMSLSFYIFRNKSIDKSEIHDNISVREDIFDNESCEFSI